MHTNIDGIIARKLDITDYLKEKKTNCIVSINKTR